MSATLEPTVTEELAPGIYDIDEAVYLKDPIPGGSLSASGAKAILECPAKYHYRQTAGSEHKDVFDFGTAAHSVVLGVGRTIEVLDFPNWTTKAAREARDAARAAHRTPMLLKDFETVTAMAEAVLRHPIASAILNPDGGKPEQTVIWHDLIWRRARFDWLPNPDTTGRPIIGEYKTTNDASTEGMARSIANFGYHLSAAWYLDGFRQVTGRDDAALVLICQEKEAPYVVNTLQLTDYALQIGRYLGERAVRRYIDCMESGVWPGYSTEVEPVSLPRWAEMTYEQLVEQDQEGNPQW